MRKAVSPMNKTYIIAIAAALFAAPLAYAHTDGNPNGTPKTYCEGASEWHTHDYGPPATGRLLWGFIDGNLEDCDGDFNAADPWCILEEITREDLNGDGKICEAADYDNHAEWSRGGAWILSDNGDLVTFGAYACFGENAHHPQYGPFHAHDAVTGGATFTVAADTVNLVGPDPVTGLDCGDFQSDAGASCTHHCTVTFPAGRDGSYQVYVTGTLGHVCTINSVPDC